jgi:Zn-dependent peptidase ImmA (M78 family)
MGSMVRVAVDTELLRWARERSRQTPDALLKAFPKLPDWESGALSPTLRQLEKYATRTRTPFGYFFLDHPPAERLPIPSFRSIRDDRPQHPSPDLLDTVYDMLRRQDWMREHRLTSGWESLAFVGAASIQDETEAVAGSVRKTLGLDRAWASQVASWQAALAHLRERAEGVGVLVMVSGIVGNNTHRALDPQEFRGFVLTDEFAPLVFINGADAKAAQIFSLAHELAHLWFNLSAAFDLRGLQPSADASEQACNAIAAELLVPRDELEHAWTDVRDLLDPFDALARQFKVSKIVIARRLLDLGYITRTQFFEFYEEYVNEDREKRAGRTGGDFIVNLDYKISRPFADAVIAAAREGSLLYSEAYELVGVGGETFEKYAARLGWDRQ